jgi:RNA polymerase sigma-70 factor (ECF subfamily)
MSKTAQKPSFEKIAKEIIPPLSRYLLRYVGDKALADDLLQETLLRVSRGLDEFEGRANVKTWAFSIATRVAADYFRAPERRLRIVDVEEADDLATGERMTDERMVLEEMNACIREVVDSLPEDYRAALILHDLEAMSAKQIANICAISVATAKIRIHRARQRLREALKNQCDFYHQDDAMRCHRKI